MITIRNAQMSIFAAELQAAFVRRLTANVRRNYSEQLAPISGPELDDIMAEAIRAASRYGLTQHADVSAFVELMFAASPDFDSHPVIRRALTTTARTAEARIRLLPVLVPEYVWTQVVVPVDAALIRKWLRDRRKKPA